MITASEALSITRASVKFNQDLLEKLEAPIRKAAEAGQRQIEVSFDHVGHGVDSLTHPYWQKLLPMIKQQGFHCSEGKRPIRHGLGMSDDTDEPRMSYFLVISW